MYFDKSRATIIGTPTEIDSLAAYSLTHTEGPLEQEWIDGGLAKVAGSDQQRSLDPTVAGILEVSAQPIRSVIIERFDGEIVTVSFVSWDSHGRVVMTEGAGEELLALTATEMSLLPSLLAQSLRLSAATIRGVGDPVEVTAAQIDAMFTGQAHETGSENSNAEHTGIEDVLDSFRHAWRASGSWTGEETDTSLTVFSAGEQGLWRVNRPDGERSPDMLIGIEPIDRQIAIDALGDVVTGRLATKGGQPEG